MVRLKYYTETMLTVGKKDMGFAFDVTQAAECDLNVDSFQEQSIAPQRLNHHRPPTLHWITWSARTKVAMIPTVVSLIAASALRPSQSRVATLWLFPQKHPCRGALAPRRGDSSSYESCDGNQLTAVGQDENSCPHRSPLPAGEGANGEP